MSYYIAIDGGGTKTEALLCTERGDILARAVGGATNPNDIGCDESGKRLHDICKRLLAALPDGVEVSILFAGVSGAIGNAEALAAALRGTARSVYVASDAVNRLSCVGRGDGACLISGTGSVCFARRGEEIRRIGGWGYLLDGAGGGYDIGRDALTAALRAHDGRGSPTALTEAFKEHLGMTPDMAIPDIYRGGKSYIAALAPLVFRAAAAGDAVSISILDRNTAYLAELLTSAAKFLSPGGASCRAVLGGSIVTAPGGLYTRLRAAVPEYIDLILPETPPVYGAFCEALAADGRDADEACRRRFIRDHNALKSERQRG